MKKGNCDHAWETVQRCFECEAIRDVESIPEPLAAAPCPEDPFKDAEIKQLVHALAAEDWRGKSTGIKEAIFLARKLAGWKRTDWTK